MPTNIYHRAKLTQFFLTIPHSRLSESHSLDLTKEDLSTFLSDEFHPETIVVVEEPHHDSAAMHLHALVVMGQENKRKIKDILAPIQNEYPSASKRIDVSSVKSAWATYMYLTEYGYVCKDKSKPVKEQCDVDPDPILIGPAPARPGGPSNRPYNQHDWTRLCNTVYRESRLILEPNWELAKTGKLFATG